MQLERYGLVAGDPDRWAESDDFKAIYQKAVETIDERFALVPEGYISMPQTVNDRPGCAELDFETPPFLLAVCMVTNAQFQKFVDTGGYDDLENWPEEIWPHMMSFKDYTGSPGPRFWREGRHERSVANHPVVGVSYYEACAYARWAGYRLAAESEWQMAASWRIRSSAHLLRRYPWGESFDAKKCNLWATGVGRTVPVDAYAEGAAPNGVLQLTGNVWEWTSSDFEVMDDDGRPIIGEMLMKSVRGGAFDTYFACQATSDFRSGAAALARTHNVGVRCALDVGQTGV